MRSEVEYIKVGDLKRGIVRGNLLLSTFYFLLST